MLVAVVVFFFFELGYERNIGREDLSNIRIV